jgi:hypothetical protein
VFPVKKVNQMDAGSAVTIPESRRDADVVDLTAPVVPQPSAAYVHTLEQRALAAPSPHAIPLPVPLPFFFSARFLIWKQDPTVGEPGFRTSFISGLILNGPKDARITTELPGTTPVARNVNADFIFTPGTAQFDCAHTWAVVRQTLTMYERLRSGNPIPWAWNTSGNVDPLIVHPRAGVTPNAYYSRGQKALKFFYFTPAGAAAPVFTCRSLDIVAHEAGHAILDGLKPGWLGIGNPPQTGGLHEAFGDLSAMFLALSQLDQVEALIALSKANMHNKNFIAALAEEFGAALGRTIGLRNADNDLKLSQVGNEVHAISQVFTGGIYDVLADIFAFEWGRQMRSKDPAHVLLEVARHMASLVLRAMIASPASGATYSHVVNQMLSLSNAQGDPPVYRTYMRSRFTLREVVVSPTPLNALLEGQMNYSDPEFIEGEDVIEMEAAEITSTLTAPQDRTGCCGTMLLPEFTTVDQEVVASGAPLSDGDLLEGEVKELTKAFS